ncbi:TonB-dependent receptor [Tepidicaulis sp.]|uniref:TonB-dependent receptor n=1 Tax=Tepidicaulis sp. TaxID=1920809 RepID=UPI003B5B98B7
MLEFTNKSRAAHVASRAGLWAAPAALALTLAALPAFAGQENAGEIVVTATRAATPVSELTRSVTVVDEETVEREAKINRNLGDILSNTTPGFATSSEALSNFGQTLRGRDFLTLIDGVPQSTPLRGGSRDLNTIDPDAIERIEIVRGGTAAYGFGATGGLVNIITKRPEDGALKAKSEVGIRFSTDHPSDSMQYQTTHSLSGREGEIDFLAAGTFVSRNSIFDGDGDRIPPDSLGVQGGYADTDEWNFLGKLGFEPDANQRFELSANYFEFLQDTEYTFGLGNPAAGIKTPAVKGSPNVEEPGTENLMINGEYTHSAVLGSELAAQVYYGDITSRFGKFPGFAQTEVQSEKWGGRLTMQTPFEVAGTGMKLLWGADYLRDETVQAGIDGPTIVPVMEQNAIAGFAELEIPVGEWGLVRGGVRYEDITVDIESVTNRPGRFVQGGEISLQEALFNLNGVVYLSERSELYGGFSQGFSVADLGRVIRDSTTINNASEVASEAQLVDNYELGLRTANDWADGSVAVFFSESEKGTTYSTTNLNLVKAPEEIWGIEAALNVTPAPRWKLGGTATWMDGHVDLDSNGSYEEDLDNTRIPPLKLTAYVDYEVTEWWDARLQALYSGHREPFTTGAYRGDSDVYTLVDFYSSFDVGPGRLELGVDNLFNEDYFPVVNSAFNVAYAYNKGPGRMASLTYSIEW